MSFARFIILRLLFNIFFDSLLTTSRKFIVNHVEVRGEIYISTYIPSVFKRNVVTRNFKIIHFTTGTF